jgi:hypothetical protein
MIKNRRMDHCRILIVGAGLAGLALARALGQAGLAPELIEGQAGWGVAGTGIYLPANGVRALRTLGLEGAVAARAAPDPPAAPPRPPRAPARRHRPPSAVGSVGPCLALPRTELHQILREGVPVQLGRTIGSLEHLDGARPGRLGRRQRRRVRPGRRGRRTALLGPATGCRPTAAGPVGQHSWRFLTARPPRGHHLDGPARPGRLLPDRPGRPGAGLLLRRRD